MTSSSVHFVLHSRVFYVALLRSLSPLVAFHWSVWNGIFCVFVWNKTAEGMKIETSYVKKVTLTLSTLSLLFPSTTITITKKLKITAQEFQWIHNNSSFQPHYLIWAPFKTMGSLWFTGLLNHPLFSHLAIIVIFSQQRKYFM